MAGGVELGLQRRRARFADLMLRALWGTMWFHPKESNMRTGTDHALAPIAQHHADDRGHHTTLIHGAGWLCQECDDDHNAWIEDADVDDIEHFSPTTAATRQTLTYVENVGTVLVVK